MGSNVQLFTINCDVIKPLTVGFSRATSFIGRVIQFVRGGFHGLRDEQFVNHAFFSTYDRGQCFATEETNTGLVENSIEEYRQKKNRIISMYYWTGWDDPEKREKALDYLAYIRRKQGDKTTKVGKYDWWGLFKFVPFFKQFAKPDNQEQWCSENVASILKAAGCTWINETEIAPDELEALMKKAPDVVRIFSFYKDPVEPEEVLSI